MTRLFLLLALYLCCTIQEFSCRKKEIYKEGDIMLGALFPIHGKGLHNDCGGEIDAKAAQLAEAMIYAIDQINKNGTLLTKNGTKQTLGAYIEDSCSAYQHAIKELVEFTGVYNRYTSDNKRRGGINKANVKGLIIIDNPNVVIPITEFLSKYDVVHIAPRTMTVNEEDYPTLVDIDISDEALSMALRKIAKALNIQEIFVIMSQTQLKTNGLVKFDLDGEENIKLAWNDTIPLDANYQDFDTVMEKMLTAIQRLPESNHTHVLLLTESEDEVTGILKAASNISKRKELKGTKLVWLASDGWGSNQNVVKGNEEIALGAITVEHTCNMSKSFSEHLENCKKGNEYWKYWHRKYLVNFSQNCDKSAGIQ